MRKVLFYRDYRGFTGGHLKVWDYYNHVKAFLNFIPQIYFSAESVWDPSNPWLKEKDQTLKNWRLEDADILFLAGMDWQILDRNKAKSYQRPIINLIQNVRHAEINDVRYEFLTNKAIRICVSNDIYNALLGNSHINGPIFVIQACLEFDSFPKTNASDKRNIDILIAGLKNPELAKILEERLKSKNINIKTLTVPVPRHEFLDLLNISKITIFLPNVTEGLHLPPLEGMRLGTFVICPDVPGVRDVCKDKYNCFSPKYNIDEIIDSLRKALNLPNNERNALLSNAKITTESFELETERKAFVNILNGANELW